VQLLQPLNVDSIRSTLATRVLGHRIELFEQLSSTNLEATTLGQSGVEHGTVVIADRQTAGRGRLARTWFSPGGANVYCSLVLRTDIPTNRLPEWLSWLPLITALAAAETIESVISAPVSLKWPNDLLMAGRKVGGILCENLQASPSGPFQVIGVGINVNMNPVDFPAELRESATSVWNETHAVVDRNSLIAQFLLEMEQCLDELDGRGSQQLALAYQRRCSTIGSKVRASLADGSELTGYAESIGQDGSLRITMQSETIGEKTVELRVADIVHLRS
jgi:BirA family transcriptional regulator, biotin operon repressor / biotin---[acetyl-CoA-carboxylase] ligase